MALKVGTSAPDFTLDSTGGNEFTLSKDLQGKACILYFYPGDFTPGCTKEACEFRDHFAEFKDLDIDILGISRDSIEKHHKFKKKHNLPFELLADLSGEVAHLYKALMPIIGITKRITYLLDKEHKIAAFYDSQFSYSAHIQNMIKQIQGQ